MAVRAEIRFGTLVPRNEKVDAAEDTALVTEESCGEERMRWLLTYVTSREGRGCGYMAASCP